MVDWLSFLAVPSWIDLVHVNKSLTSYRLNDGNYMNYFSCYDKSKLSLYSLLVMTLLSESHLT